MLQLARQPDAQALDALEEQVARDLATLSYPGKPWMKPAETDANGLDVLDVLIVGGGQSGVAIAFALKRICIENTLVIDNRDEGREGPWLTFARMHTLRTPKHLTSIDNGIAPLTLQSWYIASFGQVAWDQLGKVPREHWAAYLAWFKRVTGTKVVNGTTLTAFRTPEDRPDLIEAVLDTPEGTVTRRCRRLVFATGFIGSGRWFVPPMISDALPQALYAHTADAIDFEALKGKRIGVLGAGASAFDNAGTALEAGAASVDLFYRRERLPRINPYRWTENRGFLEHYPDLGDRWRWKFLERILRNNQPPPPDTFNRCAVHDSFTLHPSEPWEHVEHRDGGATVATPKGSYPFDFLIIGTGLYCDLSSRPEMAPYADKIAVWSDRITPDGTDIRPNPMMAEMPYLGPSYEYLEKTPGALPWAGRVYNFTYGASLSLGVMSTQISGLRFGVERLTRGITASLFAEDIEAQFDSLDAFDVPELSLDAPY